jgi:hypothetical protein
VKIHLSDASDRLAREGVYRQHADDELTNGVCLSTNCLSSFSAKIVA